MASCACLLSTVLVYVEDASDPRARNQMMKHLSHTSLNIPESFYKVTSDSSSLNQLVGGSQSGFAMLQPKLRGINFWITACCYGCQQDAKAVLLRFHCVCLHVDGLCSRGFAEEILLSFNVGLTGLP